MVKVLLTGGSGFIAAHIVDILLQHGFDTVVTVRSEEKGKRIIEAHPDVPKEKLSYVIVKDVAKDGAFDEAVKSSPPFDYVLHTASPFHFNVQDPVKDFLDPAIKGTTGILKAIKEYAPNVKRVVITSSYAAMVNGKQHPKVYSEKEWNPLTWEEAMDHSQVYRGSKTFAEKAAWAFVEKEKPNFDIATINPPLVFGPIVHYLNSLETINTSNQRMRNLIQGQMKDKIAPTGNFLWVDVRDVALAHVRAIEVPEAGGERFFVTAGFFSNKELADIIRETHPQLESRLPPVDSPSDFPANIFGIDNNKSQKVLGLKYLPLKQTVSDTVDSLLAVGV
ncbi:NAD-dependent epimerase/dehydratase [Penicillium robsamsonii]|uniref:NAD-dependent epimerase/dehydratase n=1 Tax=Penicillium robsamsonii TaxID=1792511 RepID=UPI002547F6B3|nr:NAD-dependent epimerase/dehydratase [Penicillium robsamsonii]KAJ5825105.1 NAD-dependent epimerase/dehydratase [Penicillium robsamsonii]